MAVTAEEKAKYSRKLEKYRNEVAANNKRAEKIDQHEENKAKLKEKVRRLKEAKKKINNESDHIANEIKGLEKNPDHSKFKGKNENNYWQNKKSPAKKEIHKFLKGINGEGHSITEQIDKKIAELNEDIASENSAISALKNAITNPVAPTPPND